MRDFRDVIQEATDEHKPSKRFVLFSGGNDSTALLHMVWTAGLCDAAVHVDTGTGIPEARRHVEAICDRYEIPLLVYSAGDAYKQMVLKKGFPGPGAHFYAYTMLKERQIDRLVREHKTYRRDRIMLITGVRLSESQRRMGNVVPVKRDGCSVWVSPILDWDKSHLADYRAAHDLPESEVAAILHMSGECLCGAFAHPDEIKDLETFYPETAARIHALEAEAKTAGVHCVWGTKPSGQRRSRGGLLCVGCDVTLVTEESARSSDKLVLT